MYYELQNTPDTPVSLSDAKDFLRVKHNKEDGLISGLIASAVTWGENYTGFDFSHKEWIGFFDGLCSTSLEPKPFIEIAKSPFAALTSVEVSENGSFSAFNDLFLKKQYGHSRVLFNSIPAIDDTVAYTFKVSFESGYTILPELLKTAILEHIAFLYENRGDAPSNPPSQIVYMYSQFRIIPIYA